MRDKFTEWLVHSRHVAGLTQEEAAERIGIARRTLAGYEAGALPTMTLWPASCRYTTIIRLATHI